MIFQELNKKAERCEIMEPHGREKSQEGWGNHDGGGVECLEFFY